MKVYEVGGRLVWLDKAPEGYVEPKAKKTEEPKDEPMAEPKAKKVPKNKARKGVENK